MHRTITLLALVTLILAANADAQTLPPMQVDHVIITSDELAGEFWRLAALRNAEGMRSRVVPVSWIEANVPAGVDLPATIRAFITAAQAEWGVSFVLLGGDTSVVPTRIVRSDFYPWGGYTDIPTDLYFAGLEGDWNADGDDIWGEPYVSESNPGDDADLEADVGLGRAPVSDVTSAAWFVDRTVAADQNAANLVGSALFMAEVGFEISANEICELLETSPRPPTVFRMYENPDADPNDQVLSLANATAALSSGDFGLVYHAGHGAFDELSMGDGEFTRDDALALTNAPDYFVMTSSHGGIAAFDQDCLANTLLTAPDGGAVAYVGQSREAFPTNLHDYILAFYEHLFGADPVRLGPAVNATRERSIENTERNTVDRWTVLGMTLLGDPALRMGPVPPFSSDVTGVPAVIATRLLPAAPNPFNPATTLAFDLARDGSVRLDVYGVDGRRVCTVLEGCRAAGSHRVTWRGCDDRGQAVGSGVYLARLVHDRGVESQRLVLVR